MALLLKRLYDFYVWAVNDLADPRTDNLPFVRYVAPPFILVFCYAYFVLKLGPQWMKDKKPFNLDKIMIIYNALQVIYCVFITIEGIRILSKYDWRCQPVDYSYSKEAIYMTRLVWSYYMIKILDLMDTIFFVMRKKFSQITFLHVYHHGGMVLITWGATKFLPGGHCAYLGVVNCFVHAVMYFYYLLTAYNKEYKKSIWWKKYITQLQLFQFTFFTFIYGQLLFRTNCGFPKATMFIFIPQNFFMMCLFGEFYYKTYIKPKPINSQKQNEPLNSNNSKNKTDIITNHIDVKS